MELETFGAEPEENKHLTSHTGSAIPIPNRLLSSRAGASRRDKKTVGVLLFLGIERLSFCRAERARESEHPQIHQSPSPSQHGGKHLEHGDAISSEHAEQTRIHLTGSGENNQNC